MVVVYDYDSLNRLTAAYYSNDTHYSYTYDAVGNRPLQTIDGQTTSYQYDNANWLTSVGGISYTWDNNGNLLSDGVKTYAYDHTNRLISASNGVDSYSFAYNGLGDRYQQTVNSVTTSYDLDIIGSLAQVLADGSNTYLYGINRIAQQHNDITAYFLGDALGSMRQLTTGSGEIILTNSYKPYGEVSDSSGNGTSGYGYTGEWMDETRLVYLRARYYDPGSGRFITKDLWQGDYLRPLSLNGWKYVDSNPVNNTDPSGLSSLLPPELLDHRDLTYWLYEEIHTNANGYYAQRIKHLLNSSDLSQKARAVFGWIFLVKNKARWDPKHKIQDFFGGDSIILTGTDGPAWYEYSVPGNIHYGFVGRAVGFSGMMLHSGAGYAEITDEAHKKRGEACCPKYCRDIVEDPWITLNLCVPLGCYYLNPGWVATLFDDPSDYTNVEFGVTLYNTYGEHMTFSQFQQHLTTFGGGLTPAPVIPVSRFEHPDWPYSVDYFEGPDTQKNKPIVDLLLWRFPFGE